MTDDRITVHAGDCLDVLRTMADNSIDSVVTDPPYHLTSIVKRFGSPTAAPAKVGATGAYARASAGFMGKSWDGGDIAFQPELWAEVLRVLKPGGHMLAFGGSRTYHRLACAVEDAGFEIRDQIMWVFAQGFPKAHNLKNNPICDCDEKGNALPFNHYGNTTPEHDLQSLRSSDLQAQESGRATEKDVLLTCLSEQGLSAYRTQSVKSCDDGQKQPSLAGRELHRTGQGLSDDSDAKSSEITSEWIRSGAHLNSGTDARSVTQSRRGSASQEYGTGGQSSRESTHLREPSATLDGGALSGRGACPRCGKLKKEFEGFSTALKPAHEPIVLARKPLSEATVAANVLRWGTGAINVGACRIETDDNLNGGAYAKEGARTESQSLHGGTGMNVAGKTVGKDFVQPPGRWPANLIHDGSDEVLAAFPETSSGSGDKGNKTIGAQGYGSNVNTFSRVYEGNSGSAARFFKQVEPDSEQIQCVSGRCYSPIACAGFGYCRELNFNEGARLFYQAKASKKDRMGSKHPTVKPIKLMQYLVRLITPPGGTVLDPFAGTGTTGQAAITEGCRAILIEREEEYLADIDRRFSPSELRL